MPLCQDCQGVHYIRAFLLCVKQVDSLYAIARNREEREEADAERRSFLCNFLDDSIVLVIF